MIHKCTCYSPYQDEMYGEGNRVFNPMTGSAKHGRKAIARCTVCGYLLQSSAGVVNQAPIDLQLVTHNRR